MGSGICLTNSTRVGNTSLTVEEFYGPWMANMNVDCAKDPSYIRPDDAGSILPWPYTLAWFLIHFPVTLIRVHRWERVQALSIILAIITIWFQLQAYTSSIHPDSVLVWMPIFVVLDIGAMMQLFFLIVEDTGFWPLVRALPLAFRWNGRRSSTATTDTSAGLLPTQEVTVTDKATERRSFPPMWNGIGHEDAKPELVGRAWICLLAVLLGLLLLAIQLFGLVIAIKGSQTEKITAQWCSTLFASSIAVVSGCQMHNVTASFSQGIGCITLKGYEQYTWLKASIIILSLSLAFQVFDCIILSLVSGKARWRGAKMKRPWFTMFTGNIVLLVLIIVG
ncbi:hypothetical protein ACJ41O_012181 [Fusarium nematophilum]